MECMKRVMALICLSVTLIGCSGNNGGTVSVDKVQMVQMVQMVQVVSADDHVINGQLMLSINIGPTPENYFDISLRHSDFKAGYSVVVHGRENANISIGGNWDGSSYSQSSKHPTSLSFTVLSVTPTEAVIEVTAKLVSVGRDSEKFLTLEKSLLKIQGENFNNLALK